MSFSSSAKEELMRITSRHFGCVIAELSAIAQVSGSILLGRGGMGLSIQVESNALARKIYTTMKQAFLVDLEISVKDSRRLNKQHVYFVTVRQKLPHILKTLGLMERGSVPQKGLPKECSRSCCRKAFLRGVFLACGSVSNPEKAYRLEMVFKNTALCEAVRMMLTEDGIKAGVSQRKGDHVLYMKDADSIGVFLALIGAHNAILQHENARIIKQMRNQANRALNCDQANLDKTVSASARQCACIRFLMEAGEFDSLSDVLREAGELRLNHPEGTIAELADLCEAPTGKSGMNHRLRKLCKLAEEMGFAYENEENA